MSDENSTETGAPADEGQGKTDPETAPAALQAALTQAQEEAARLRTELEAARQAELTDQERALEDAKAEARRGVLAELGAELVKAELRAQGASAGVDVADSLEYLNLTAFTGEDGRPSAERIGDYIEKQKIKARPDFPELHGAGTFPSRGSDISSMNPTELADMITDGRFL
ncbi:hypothetical protein [Streptomyces buecherae]|uniref:hypothetical protein n=1 Tax=Streptomyces buecherae TaxID=2763006 RepID=UPI00164CFCB7|nr:hypothetical protein [Streptomyces buecherae]QNJ42026.1 hypothetical protein H7H31_21360 [Streptomyces buecherae]